MSTIAAAPGFGFDARRPARSAASRPASSALRLTRRGRVVVLALFLVLAFGLMTMFGGESTATDEAGTPVATRTVMVDEGDTLWGIAAEVAEPGEVREMIHRIKELNALPSASLQRGQRIAVPLS